MPRKGLQFALLFAALVAAWPATAQTTFVYDTFTAGANQLLEAHTPDVGGAWSRFIGVGGIVVNAAADNARNVAGGDWNIYTNAAVPPASEYVVGVTATFGNSSVSSFVDLFGRVSTAGGFTGYSADFTGNGTVLLIRWNAGVGTILDSAVVTINNNTPYTILLSITDASKEVWINGTQVLSSTDNTITAAGLVGLGMQSNSAGAVIADNYFASTFAPTAVHRLEGTATFDGSRTLVEWTTTREADNLGFRVYRMERGRRVPVSRGIIAGAAFLVAGAKLPGQTYRILSPGTARAYWIEEIDLHGDRKWHGPIVPSGGRFDARIAPSPALTEIGQGSDSVSIVRPAALSAVSHAQSSKRRRASASASSSSTQGDIAAGNAIKIGVREDGIYRVTRAELLAIDSSFDIGSARMHADGVEVAIAIENDAILFYGLGLDTRSTDTRVYWLTWGHRGGARMDMFRSSAAAATAQRSFTAVVSRRDKTIYVAADLDPSSDGFVGPLVSADPANPTRQVLRPGHGDRTTNASLTVELFGAASIAGQPDHRVAVALNGTPLGEVSFAGRTKANGTFTFPATRLIDGDNVVGLSARNGDIHVSAVLATSMTYEHTFEADSDHLLAVVDENREHTFRGFSAGDVRLFDVTDAGSPLRIEPSRAADGAVTFTSPRGGARTILATRAFARPAFLARNVPSSLNKTKKTDVVMISHPSLVSALAPLADLRRAQGMSVVIATIDDVYDEFSFGAKEPDAITAFLARAAPRYVLLAGDASFDHRNYLGLGDFDLVPTKMVISTLLRVSSDTTLTDFDGDHAPNIPIGRLSARTLAEARTMVDKIVRYETSATPASRNVVFVADLDPGFDFAAAARSLARVVSPPFTSVQLETSVAGRQQLLSGFGDAAIIDYIGHGSSEIWSSGSFFRSADAASLPAGDRPPIVLAITCLNGQFHDLFTDSLAEALMRGDGGAVAVWASSALTSPDAQLPVNEAILRALTSGSEVRLGDAILAAQKESFTPDMRRTFVLFGDPAMRIK